MTRANHEFLMENCSRYVAFYELGLGQVQKSEDGGQTIIRLFDPNDVFKTSFETISMIWPILKPEFNRKVRIESIQISPKPILNNTEFHFNGTPNTLTVDFSNERVSQLQTVVTEALDFYCGFLIEDLFSIQIRNLTGVNWNPYTDGDINIIKDLTDLIKSSFIKGCENHEFLSEGSEQTYWVREIMVGIKNSSKYIPEDLIQKTRKKYIELDFILSSVG